MKPYLVTTGALFAVLAIAHMARAIAEWPGHEANSWYFAECGVGVVAACLCFWAWKLFARTART
jgi:hypothetical protein